MRLVRSDCSRLRRAPSPPQKLWCLAFPPHRPWPLEEWKGRDRHPPRYDVISIELPTPRRGRLRVDGMRDIFANKLSAVIERVEPKDYVDLCFLLRQPGLTLALGLEDCRRKFGWPGLESLLQAAFLRSGRLAELPQTEPPLDVEELRALFRGCARALIELDNEA